MSITVHSLGSVIHGSQWMEIKNKLTIPKLYRQVSTMDPRFLSSAQSRTNSPESVLHAERRHRSNKVARAPEDFFDFHILLANFFTKLPGPLLRIRRGTHCQDKVCHCPTPSVILLTILSQTNSEADLVRWVGKPLLPGKSAQEKESCCINCSK